MTNEAYKAPQSELLMESEEKPNQFYVVSKVKLSALYLATLGLYLVYWFYVNWRNFKNTSGVSMMPAIRSIFYIFFTHLLFSEVDETLKSKEIEYQWSPSFLATLFVALTVVSSILDRLLTNSVDYTMYDVIALAILPLLLLIVLKAQDAINLSQGDPSGSSNSNFTIYNVIWLLLGVVFWLLVVVGFLDGFGVISLEE